MWKRMLIFLSVYIFMCSYVLIKNIVMVTDFIYDRGHCSHVWSWSLIRSIIMTTYVINDLGHIYGYGNWSYIWSVITENIYDHDHWLHIWSWSLIIDMIAYYRSKIWSLITYMIIVSDHTYDHGHWSHIWSWSVIIHMITITDHIDDYFVCVLLKNPWNNKTKGKKVKRKNHIFFQFNFLLIFNKDKIIIILSVHRCNYWLHCTTVLMDTLTQHNMYQLILHMYIIINQSSIN